MAAMELSLENMEAVNRQREVYNILFDNLGPAHPGTIKAKYELARCLMDINPADEEAFEILKETVQCKMRDVRLGLDSTYDDLVLRFVRSCYYNGTEEDDESIIDLLDSLLSDPGWASLVTMPNRHISEYEEMTDILVSLLSDRGEYDRAYFFQEMYTENLVKALPYSSMLVVDAVAAMGDIYLESGEKELSGEYGSFVDNLTDNLLDRYEMHKSRVSAIKEEDSLDYVDLYETLTLAYRAIRSVLFYLMDLISLDPFYNTPERRNKLVSAIDELISYFSGLDDLKTVFTDLGDEEDEEEDEAEEGTDDPLLEFEQEIMDGSLEEEEEDIYDIMQDFRAFSGELEKVRSIVADNGDMTAASEMLNSIFSEEVDGE